MIPDEPGQDDQLTESVADWVMHSAVHWDRLWTAAKQGPSALERAILNLLRGTRTGAVDELRRTLHPHDFERVDWTVVAAQVVTCSRPGGG